MDYFTTDLTSLHEKLVNKDLSVEELTKETFKTIKDRDQQIAAFLALNEEAALKQAKGGHINASCIRFNDFLIFNRNNA